MLFNSLQFLVFFPVVTTIYFALPYRYRWLFLLGASCYFYMAFVPAYLLILLFTITIDFVAGIFIEKTPHPTKRLFLLASIVANLSILAIFKYANFASGNLTALAAAIGWNYSLPLLNIILPIGLSFHTFQAMSYTIEVYYGRQRAERHLGIFALYVLFYPQLVAGPIERPQNLLGQFREQHVFDYGRVVAGLQLMIWGFFKKIVIADNLALYVDAVYNNPETYHGLPVILATYFFALQIYCDFSGYSNIAIGAAQVMGYDLMKNFRQPYFSKSIPEFWRRWHISLSSWFRDYLYIPLGGNRGPAWRTYRNLAVVFLISGLWHGASWGFVLWGALHAIYMVVAVAIGQATGYASRGGPVLEPNREGPRGSRGGAWFPLRLRHLLAILATFHLVVFSWVFFRAATLTDAIRLLRGMADFDKAGLRLALPNFDSFQLVISALLILCLICFEIIDSRYDLRAFFAAKPVWIRWGVFQLLLILILVFGVYGQTEFIYFQF